ncbi:MAG: lasso peptide biosynthesis B2 protein [Phenylobacterium sp.]|uniref:lasso peptide biosynthesis B2 protein n=1 Tax=Phenylobacterium sp. TaxID=1871053 RepID=UPI00391886CB
MTDAPFQALVLRRDVHAARVGDDLVFLDVSADAYSCLPSGAEAIDLRPDGSLAASASLASQLLRAGLAQRNGSPPGPRAMPPPVRATLSPHTARPARPRHLPDIVAVTADVLRHYRGRSFSEVLAAGRVSPRAGAAAEDLATLVADFHAWIPWAPISGKCLIRSFVLRRWLARRGHATQWVFGVATWPFRAHCWLQSGDLALDDVPERLQAFERILVV